MNPDQPLCEKVNRCVSGLRFLIFLDIMMYKRIIVCYIFKNSDFAEMNVSKLNKYHVKSRQTHKVFKLTIPSHLAKFSPIKKTNDCSLFRIES